MSKTTTNLVHQAQKSNFLRRLSQKGNLAPIFCPTPPSIVFSTEFFGCGNGRTKKREPSSVVWALTPPRPPPLRRPSFAKISDTPLLMYVRSDFSIEMAKFPIFRVSNFRLQRLSARQVNIFVQLLVNFDKLNQNFYLFCQTYKIFVRSCGARKYIFSETLKNCKILLKMSKK